MTNAEVLVAQEEIRQLKARYCRFLDTKQWEKWGDLFALDATVAAAGEGEEVKGMVAGRETLRWVNDQVGKAVTVHHVFAPEIQIASGSRASGIWGMEDIVTFGEDVAKRPFKSLKGFGHYHETYVADGGRWYIQSIRLSRIKQDIT